MSKLLLVAALFGASFIPPSSSLAARGPKPTPTPTDCQLDISGRLQCAYPTKDECLAALRKLRRTHPDVQGCWLSTADPDWWHYGQYILEYYP